MQVKVLKRFKDKYTGEIYRPGDVLNMTKARADEVRATLAGLIDVNDNERADDAEEMCEVAQKELTYAELKARAKELGLSMKGTKEVLAKRIQEAENRE